MIKSVSDPVWDIFCWYYEKSAENKRKIMIGSFVHHFFGITFFFFFQNIFGWQDLSDQQIEYWKMSF